MDDLDEILEKDVDQKINWLISQVYDLRYEVSTIKNNHLAHIDMDISDLKRKVYIVGSVIVTFLTGQNLLM